MKKGMLLLVSLIIVFSSLTFAKDFSDLPRDHWAYEAVNKMSEKGILSGYPDGSFKPNTPITRAEFAKILVVFLDLPEAAYSGVADVPNTHWAAKYIDSALSFMFAYEEDGYFVFKPEEYALREDAAFAIARAMHLSWINSKPNTLDRFSDKELISESLRPEVSLAVDNGLMQGNEDGTFNPKGYLTRAEVSQLFYNILNKPEYSSRLTQRTDNIEKSDSSGYLAKGLEMYNKVKLGGAEKEVRELFGSPTRSSLLGDSYIVEWDLYKLNNFDSCGIIITFYDNKVSQKRLILKSTKKYDIYIGKELGSKVENLNDIIEDVQIDMTFDEAKQILGNECFETMSEGSGRIAIYCWYDKQENCVEIGFFDGIITGVGKVQKISE